MWFVTCGATRPTITPQRRPSAGGSVNASLRLVVLFAVLACINACAAQPRMLSLAEGQRPEKCRAVLSESPVRVNWLVPDATDHRARLDQTCAGAGPVVVQRGETDRQAGAKTSPLVVVSWNTYLGRGNLAELVSRLERGEFTGGARVDRFVLLLQEVFRAPILAFARERMLHAVFAPARRRDGDAEDRGAAILASSPIEEITIVELP